MPCPECGEFMNIEYEASCLEHKFYECNECHCSWEEQLVIRIRKHGHDYYLKQRLEEENKYKEVLYKIQDIEG